MPLASMAVHSLRGGVVSCCMPHVPAPHLNMRVRTSKEPSCTDLFARKASLIASSIKPSAAPFKASPPDSDVISGLQPQSRIADHDVMLVKLHARYLSVRRCYILHNHMPHRLQVLPAADDSTVKLNSGQPSIAMKPRTLFCDLCGFLVIR
jgi:hypothetical protein